MKRIAALFALTALSVIAYAQQMNLVSVQDTFFGLKMGETITETVIKSAVKNRYKGLETYGNSIGYLLSNIDFAGRRWSEGCVETTASGKFYRFVVHEDFPEQETAENFYSALQDKFYARYGKGRETRDGDGWFRTTYIGSNDMCVEIRMARTGVRLIYEKSSLKSKVEPKASFPDMEKKNANPDGKPDAHVKGRNTVGSMPRPVYNATESGMVVVDIWVDNYGNVVKAVPEGRGTTVTDKALLTAARKAALETHFNMSADAPATQKGTITYYFNSK